VTRCLLMIHNRVGQDTFSLTHDLLAAVLGARRASVTIAVGRLRQAGVTCYSRGTVRVCDRMRLENGVCEDYRFSRKVDQSLYIHRE